MSDNYQNLTEQELIDRLQELSEKLAQARRINIDFEDIKQEILGVQEEIDARKHQTKKKWRFL